MRLMPSVWMVVLGCVMSWQGAGAQQAPVPAPAPAAPAVAAPGGIDGFRSAKFGATEAQVKAAIRDDFKIPNAQIKEATHPLERTRSLSIAVRDLISGGGEAQIAYVFGFRSKTLIQVNILWSAADPAAAEITIGIGNALRDHFIGQAERFVKDQIKANVQLPDGRILLFRALDEKGHAVELVMVVAARPPLKGQTPDSRPGSAQLRLVYAMTPDTPDIQRIKPGQF